jgi:jumonji domain-containing protein 2
VVWARHKNGRYYKGRVANISESQFYMVLFSDGSFSDDLYPEDITVSFMTGIEKHSLVVI